MARHKLHLEKRMRLYNSTGCLQVFDVMIEIDSELLIERMAVKAARNATGRSGALDRAVKVQVHPLGEQS